MDDGYSGANFQRPGFQSMLADIEAGKVGTVIVKDMSRLGRNYLQVGMYTEMIFPQKGVRFIAINDGVDSAQGDNDFAPLRNIFNEWLVRDTSKKIKAVKRSKGMSGKPITSKPVYGYLMDEDENFIIDEEAAPVVKQIYNLCLAGNGPTKIARMLTEQQIPTPGTLEYRRTGSTRRYHPGYECKWATNTVVHILENREYTGCLVNFKTEKLSYKVKHSVENPPEKQVIFENHHEPIIDTQTWERVQELRKQRKRPNRYDEVGLFSGILFCADCGSVMYQQRYQTDKRKQDCYICGNYKKRTHDCTAHFIRTDLLTAGVLSTLPDAVAETPDIVTQTLDTVTESPDTATKSTFIKRKEKERKENILPNPPLPKGGDEGEEGGDFSNRKPAKKKHELTQSDIDRMQAPADGHPRNLSGLLDNLRLYHIPPSEQYAIVLKSNYGEIGGKVWKGFGVIRASAGKIKLPGHYLLSVLNN